MERLPVEIKRIIACNLRNCDENPHGPRDIKSFRLVNTQYSIIGAEFLLPVIYLTFQTRSFERLRSISQHLLLRKHVKRLLYDAWTFDGWPGYQSVEETREWRLINDRKPPMRSRFWRYRNATLLYEKELEAFETEAAAARADCRRKFEAFRAYESDQKSIRRQKDCYNVQLVAQAIATLPNLTEVSLSFTQGEDPPNHALERAYADSPHLPNESGRHRCADGVMQLWSILYSVVSAGNQLKTLKLESMGLYLLQKFDDHQIRLVKRSLKHLEALRIVFKADFVCLGEDNFSQDEVDCNVFLRSYQMSGILSAARAITVLSLCLDQADSFGVELKHMVRSTTWASLREVELDGFDTKEDTLVEFLQRHTGTLKVLGLHNIMLDHGNWISILPKIQNAVELEDFRTAGMWGTKHPPKWRDICTPPYSLPLKKREMSRCYELGTAVKRYILQGGTNPLLDASMWP